MMPWILTSIILAIGLSMDCLALSVADGLVYQDLNKRRIFFVAGFFAVMHMALLLLGFFLGETFYEAIKNFDHWVAFGLLFIIGGKMIFDGIKGLVKPEASKPKNFSVPSILFQGLADSIDAFAVGIAIRSTLSIPTGAGLDYQIYICFGIIALGAFLISLLGLFGGKFISKILKGKYEIADIIGGLVLLALAIKVVVESYI